MLRCALVSILPFSIVTGAPGPPSLAGGGPPFPAFSEHRIDDIGQKLGQTALADIDRDGDLDWVAGEADHGGSRIWWWEYRGPDDWVRHDVGKGHTDVGAAVHDVDGDGWPDILSGSVLLRNTGKPREEAFERSEVGTIYSHDTEFADVDGDGQIDALANSDRTGLFWYTIPADPTEAWTAHTIATKDEQEIHAGISPKATGDIDGDGDTDVVTARAWYENADGKGIEWKAHRNIDFGEKHQYGIAVRTWVGDLDGDGDPDVVQAEADNPDGRVAWFENDGKGEWTRHLIQDEGGKQDYHSLVVADFDLDGDLDVFSGGGPLSEKGSYRASIWENTAGPNGTPTTEKWVEHVVSRKPCHEAVGADVDRDGDIDVCFKPWSTGSEHVYLRNLAVESRRSAAGDRGSAAADPGWKLVWSDEFEKDGRPDPASWTYEEGFVRNAELQWYQPENAWCEGGRLIIEARKESVPNPRFQKGSRDWKRNRETAEYTSAAVTTRGLREWRYGRIEMRGKIDVRSGLWPAFWTLGSQRPWPACGEVDVMEYYRDTLLANACWASSRRWVAVWDTVKVPLRELGGEEWAKEFHTWRMDWNEDAIEIFLDQKLLNRVELTKTMNQDGSETNPFHVPHYLILDLAIGGTQGGDPSATGFPARFEVDWVRVYERASAESKEDAGAKDDRSAPSRRGNG